MTKFIFITGGVASSIGKGLTSASLGALLQSRGYKVILRKLDPYLNVDPGTMSPVQHGEVFVTDDGAETDLDLGHYERFGINCTKLDSITAGRIYLTLLDRERKGEYLGATVQVIPHVTNLIKEFIFRETKKADFVLCEIGGTVGDIEALPFLEAARQINNELVANSVKFVHVTLLPYISAAKELKTKPTQHSVKELRAIGVQPDVILCRTSKPISDKEKEKIALFCNVNIENVIAAFDIDNLYKILLHYHAEKLDERLIKLFNIRNIPPAKIFEWENIIDKISKKNFEINIAIVGKYSLRDSYISLIEAIKHASIEHHVIANIKWINSRGFTEDKAKEKLSDVDAVLVPGGFGVDGIEGKINAIKYAREKKIPFLGICLGMQLAVIEFARNICKLKNAYSSEFKKTDTPIIGLLNEWLGKDSAVEKRDKDGNLGGTMRLGAYDCILAEKSKAKKIYNKEKISERHRHRYEFNNEYREILSEQGIVFSGVSPDKRLVEIVELTEKDHPWYVGVQFHPELKSRPLCPHPLFCSFLEAAIKFNKKRK